MTNLKKPAFSFRLRGMGRYLPERVMKSSEIDQKAGWPEGTTATKFRIKQRHYASDMETTTFMGAKALEEALKEAGLQAGELDLLISAAASVEQPIPYQASLLHRAIGLEKSGIPCFDIDTTCLSFVTALHVAAHFLAAGTYKRIAIVTSEIASIAINWEVPECFTLFGDGAACWILEADPTGEHGLFANHLKTYSYGSAFCEMRAGATKYNMRRPPPSPNDYLFSMDGPEAFKLAVTYVHEFMAELMGKSGLSLQEIDLIAPHQASPLALHHMKTQLRIPDEKYVNYIADYGNQVAASIPIALYRAREEGRWTPGKNLLLVGTSAGISLGGAILRL
ncbi:MAG: 3-oxoacyl-[acyl-carrier-protein] synthase III C-terminal domain-containing protein [Bdellovibrionota bacterium]